ncbi:MAG: glycoside hydrolase family 88 protein [Lachnospiraceae bacterium]|nr:glycoside hydrolase family 88 protein [Lachnospiraceae bacterium]
MLDNQMRCKVKNVLLCMQRHSWEQGVAMQAFLESGEGDLVIDMAFEAVNRMMDDGRVATIGVTDGVTDPCSTGEALLYACRETQDTRLSQAAGRLLDWTLKLAPRNPEGIVYHLTRTKEFWADSFYMLPPYLAAAGAFEEGLKQWNGYWNALYDSKAGLICHMWNDETGTFTRAAHWGIGNGWALASVPRMMALWPDQRLEEERSKMLQKAGALLDALLHYMTPEGYFHDVVDDENTFVETNLSQLTAYTIYRGMRQGWLPVSYEDTAVRLQQAAEQKIDSYGFVRDVCGAPTFDKPGIAPEAQAFCLLMEEAARNWKEDTN